MLALRACRSRRLRPDELSGRDFGGERQAEVLLILVFRYTKRQGNLDIAIDQDGYRFLREIQPGQEHLWSLWDDLGEQENLIATYPTQAQLMRRNLDDYFRRLGWNQNEHLDVPRRKRARSNVSQSMPD